MDSHAHITVHQGTLPGRAIDVLKHQAIGMAIFALEVHDAAHARAAIGTTSLAVAAARCGAVNER